MYRSSQDGPNERGPPSQPYGEEENYEKVLDTYIERLRSTHRESGDRYLRPHHFAVLPDGIPALDRLMAQYIRNIVIYEDNALGHLCLPSKIWGELTACGIEGIDILEMLSKHPESIDSEVVRDAVTSAAEYLRKWRETFG